MNEIAALRSAVHSYLSSVARALASVSEEEVAALAQLLLEARRRRGTLYLLGNGGSAATASHAASDLAKTATPPGARPLRAVNLADNVALLTAWANDTCYEDVFAAQIEQTVRAGDIVLGLSGSGDSENVLRAMEAGRRRGATAIGLAGFAGGRLRQVADRCLVVEADWHGVIEDVHLSIMHALTEALRRDPAGLGITAEAAASPVRGGDGDRPQDGDGT